MNGIIDSLFDYLTNKSFTSDILPLILSNKFVLSYFLYLASIILTTFAVKLITKSLKDNKISTMITVLLTKISIFIFLQILEHILTK